MKQPKKWRETIDPFKINFHNFTLLKILGYPHAGNDVFYVKGIYKKKQLFAFLKVVRNNQNNFENEVNVLKKLRIKNIPQLLDYGDNYEYVLTKKIVGYRLSYLLEKTPTINLKSYMFEYGKTLALIHISNQSFGLQKERKFFNIPSLEYCKQISCEDAYYYLIKNKPQKINYCFCHGDFHYANILWNKNKISGIIDWEISGLGNKEFDIAWALINRPSQNFLKTEEEFLAFISGYKTISNCDVNVIIYYMIQIYLYFYKVGKDNPNYQKFVLKYIKEKIKK